MEKMAHPNNERLSHSKNRNGTMKDPACTSLDTTNVSLKSQAPAPHTPLYVPMNPQLTAAGFWRILGLNLGLHASCLSTVLVDHAAYALSLEINTSFSPHQRNLYLQWAVSGRDQQLANVQGTRDCRALSCNRNIYTKPLQQAFSLGHKPAPKS